ncbi:hypothetical protein Bca52824_070527 [Brassica carinata]|uniref:RNase H type-1 domain-containing protein n=1 Tax=Brassica carinata TaxID=52824 RepID=A0A8X7Q8E3_BRACI|nr:hypothetical protein Bca52824_070527 [Brassica carinata]
MAESLALRQGIKEALSLGRRSVSFHSDCATLIRAISTQSQIKEIYGVLQDIKHLSANFDRINFLQISRSQNREIKPSDNHKPSRTVKKRCFDRHRINNTNVRFKT